MFASFFIERTIVMEGIYQHFRREEQSFIDAAAGWIAQAENQYSPYLTPFIDPRQAFILKSLLGKNTEFMSVSMLSHERQRLLIKPDYFVENEDDYKMCLFSIRYPMKFSTLSHPEILGALMNIGMKREVFGDILNVGSDWQFVVEEEVANYVQLNLTKIGKVNIQLERVPFTEALSIPDDYVDKFVTVSSMRLDSVIATVLNISRQKVKTMIEAGLVKVNWQLVKQATFECNENDMLSVRKHGRIQLLEQVGKSKKDKLKLNVRTKG